MFSNLKNSMNENKNFKYEIAVCHACGGAGIIRSANLGEAICRNCAGKGAWIQRENIRFFWLPKAEAAETAVNYFNYFSNIFIKGASWIFVIFVYLAAADFVREHKNGFLSLLSERGIVPLAFWLAAAILLYRLYRMKFSAEEHWGETLEGLRNFSNRPSGLIEINIDRFLAKSAKAEIKEAIKASKAAKNSAQIWYLFRAIASDPEISAIFEKLEQSSQKVVKLINEKIKEAAPDSAIYGGWSLELKKTALFSFIRALLAGENEIGKKNIFIALVENFKNAGFLIEELGLRAEDLGIAVWWAERKRDGGFWARLFQRNKSRRVEIKHRIMNRAWTARPTPLLDCFSYDITDYAAARAMAPTIGREREIGEVMRVLERNSKNNVLLIGETGSGREAIVRAIGRLMVRDEALSKLKDKRLVSLDAPLIISGAKAGGELEERIQMILREIQLAGNIILFIPNIHSLAESGAEHGFDISEILTPVFTQSFFQVIGATTFFDYHRVIEKRGDFADTFEIVKVDEVSSEVALEIIVSQAPAIEDEEEVSFTFSALKKSIELSRRYIFNKLLPAKAIDLLSEAAVMARVNRGKNAIVGESDIMKLVTEKTGIPVIDINVSEAKKLINLEEEIHKRMVDQSEAVSAVSEAIKRMRVGLKNEKKPMGVFLFLGPTGVGKTELAKTLAEVYFGSEKTMVRLDMSEFQEPRSIDRLIGNIESQVDGILTEGVKRQPFSLVLLDEFEKSHPNVLDLFLQVFDDGRLTDGSGRVVDFTNTIIIATSNAGSKIIQARLKEGKSIADFKPEIEDYILKYFKPELLNRFNAQIVFKTLLEEDILAIAKLQIKKLTKRLDEAQGIKLEVSPAALAKVAALGYSPFYGARNLQRMITEKIENLIANKFLRGEIKRGKVFTIEKID